MHEVAWIAREEHILELRQLNEKDARILFCKNAFRRENNKDCPKELEDYSVGILNKCQGSPLAIVAIGSLLSFKEKSKAEWKKVHDHLDWEFENNPNLDKVKNILNLSFNDLPCNLRNCFVFCSIFPEDYLIPRKKLIRLWVAEGFMEATSSNKVMEEEADDYLVELVDRSMLQVVVRNEFERPKYFRMHDVVREVTLTISRKAKFCMILDGSQSVLDNQTRRLSIQTNDESIDLKKNLPRLRSLVMFSNSNFSSFRIAVLNRFKTLRVLELERVTISNLPNKVSGLFNLRYLGLRRTSVNELPNNIQKLQNLQTLDLRDSKIKKLPHGVTQLKQLRHLFGTDIEVEFGGAVPTPEGEWQWKNVQTLRSIKATEKLLHLLGDMKELRSLEVVEVQQGHCPQLCTSLTKMRNLHRLYLSTEEQLNFEMLNSPLPLLKKLDLWGRLFEGKLPRFICSCAELTRVELWKTELIEDPLPSLGQLSKLVELQLQVDAFVGQKLHFRTGWFLDLRRLFLAGLENLNDIVIEKGAMISLRKLFMIGLIELKTVPRGIQFLTHLQAIYLSGMPNELEKELRERLVLFDMTTSTFIL